MFRIGFELLILTNYQYDCLFELFQSGIPQVTEAVNSFLGVNIGVDKVEIAVRSNHADFQKCQGSNLVAINQLFRGSCEGYGELLVERSKLREIAQSSYDDFGTGLDFYEFMIDIGKELTNLIANSTVGILGNHLMLNHDFSVPVYREPYIEELDQYQNDDLPLLEVRFSLELGIRGEKSLFRVMLPSRSLLLIQDCLARFSPRLKA